MPGTNYLSLYNFGTPWGQKPAGSGPGNAPTASPGNLQGSNPQGGAGPYGGIPQVPSPINTQGQAISGNMGNLGNLYNLGNSLNTNIAQQAALPYNLNLPGYQGMIGQSSGNILSLLQGQVPQDVANQISQMAAERGVATGSIGSPNANTALLRSLGLTSLGLQQQGEGELTGAIGRTPTGQQFNPQSFLVSPDTLQQAQYQSNLLSAAPDPTLSAQQELTNAFAGLGYGRGSAGGGGRPLGLGYSGGGSQVSAAPANAGFGPGGVPNPAQTGGTAYASSTPYTGMTQSDADYLGLSEPQANPTSGQFYGGFNWMQSPYYGLGLGSTMAYPGDPNVYGGPPGQAMFSGGGFFEDPQYAGNPFATQWEQLPSGAWYTTHGASNTDPYSTMGGGTPLAPQEDVTSTDWFGP